MENKSPANSIEEDEIETEVDKNDIVDKNGYRKNVDIFSTAKCRELNISKKIGECMQIIPIDSNTISVLRNLHDFSLAARRAESIFLTYLLYNDVKIYKGDKLFTPEPIFYEKIMRVYFYKIIREIYISCIYTAGFLAYDIVKVTEYDSIKNRYVTYSVPQKTDMNSGTISLIVNKNNGKRDLKFTRHDKKLVKKWDEFYFDPNTRFLVNNYPTTGEDNLKKFMDGDISEMELKIPLECQVKPLIRFSKYLSDKNESNSKLKKESNHPKLIIQNKAPLKDEEMKNFVSLYNNTEMVKQPLDFHNVTGLNNYKENMVYSKIQRELTSSDECINTIPIDTLINKDINMDINNSNISSIFQRAKRDGTGVYIPPRMMGKNEIYEFSPFQEFKGLLDTRTSYIDTLTYENFVNAKYCELYGMPETSLSNKIVSTAEIESENKFMDKTADTLKLIMSPMVSQMFNVIFPDDDGSGEFTVEFQTTPEMSIELVMMLWDRGILGDDYMKIIVNRLIDPGFSIDVNTKDEADKKMNDMNKESGSSNDGEKSEPNKKEDVDEKKGEKKRNREGDEEDDINPSKKKIRKK